MIDDVVLFLEGKTVDVRIRLRERMQQASQQLDFERAAQWRDALKWLDQLEQPQAVELIGRGDADAVGLARDGDDVCGVVLRVRDGKLIARDHWFLENAEHETEGAILAAFLVRCYLPLEVRAQRALLPFPPDDLASLTELAPAVDWHVPQRGSDAKLAELADQNARYLLDGLKIESFDIDERSADPVFALGRDLGLAAVPRAFVCIDISTNQGRPRPGARRPPPSARAGRRGGGPPLRGDPPPPAAPRAPHPPGAPPVPRPGAGPRGGLAGGFGPPRGGKTRHARRDRVASRVLD